jgi:hypothetical protein
MGASDLEIYEVGGVGPDGEPLPSAGIRRWRHLVRTNVAPIALLTLAAAAAVYAPFTVLAGYRETFRPDGTITTDTFTHRVDGWGRARDLSSEGVVVTFGHDIRYGIATCACAALLLAAVAAALPTATRWRARLSTALAGAAAGLLGGILAVQALHIEAARSQYASASGPASGAAPHLRTEVGPCVWIGLAAVAAAVAGLALMLHANAAKRVGAP